MSWWLVLSLGRRGPGARLPGNIIACTGCVGSVDEDSRRDPEVGGKLLDVRERERALAAQHLGDERFAAQDWDEIDLPQIVRLHEKAQCVHPTARGYRDVGLLVGLDQVGERIQIHVL